jgi:hypothetical protein
VKIDYGPRNRLEFLGIAYVTHGWKQETRTSSQELRIRSRKSPIECRKNSALPVKALDRNASSAASAHLGLVCPTLKYFDVAPPAHFLVEDIAEGLKWRDLNVEPSDRPGLGLELKEEAVAKYATA